MQAGMLRHRVNVERLTGSTPNGFGGTYQQWSILYHSVPAQIMPISARETWEGATVQSQRTHKITLRYISGIDSTMRLTFNGRVFNILGFVNEDERNICLDLDCKENFTPDIPAVLVSLQTITGSAYIAVVP